MIKRLLPVLLLICLLPSLAGTMPVLAGNGLKITDRSVEMDFPARLVFHIAAESDAEITDIRLHYRINRMEHAQVTSEIYLRFTPAKSVATSWTWDMRKTGGLPPGSSLSYWWTVKNIDGDSVESIPAIVNIEDDRFNWRSITEENVTIYWYEGKDSFADTLMQICQDALSALKENTGAELEEMISLYIYANSQDLRGSMIFPQEWTGGVAFTQYGIIAIGIAPNSGGLDWAERVIAHELTHLVIHRVIYNPYTDLPTWLDEGLAMVSEGKLEGYFVDAIDKAVDRDELITVRSLVSPFSAYADEAYLAYGESRQIVNYLIEEYGRDKMFELLSVFKHGTGPDEALGRVYGFDMDELNVLWQEYYAY